MKLYVVSLFAIIISLTTGLDAFAGRQAMLNRQLQKHPEIIRETINVWATNQPDSAYEKPLTELLRCETKMMAYGVDIHDDLLVGHLMENNGETVPLRIFASRLFFRTFQKDSHWEPDMTSVLDNKEYRITTHALENALGPNEFILVTN